MTSVITVNMRVCSKTARITAELQPDGETVSIHIASDCEHLREYAQRLTEVSTADILSVAGSRIEDPEVRKGVSPTCLVPTAIFNVAWLESGMMSKRLAQDTAKENSIVFEKD